MRYPYDQFIKFLITRGADVNGTLEHLGLPPLTANEIGSKDILSGSLPPSVREFIDSSYSKVESRDSFLSWTEAHGLRELWEIQPEFLDDKHRQMTGGSSAMRVACDLFASPNRRTAMSLLLMRDFEEDDIVDIFADKFNLEIDQNVLFLCRSYFFNFSDMQPTDWHNLLHNLPADQRDKLQIGRDQHSKGFVEYSVGKVPKLTFEEVLDDIMVTSYYKFKALVDQPLMDTLSQR